MYTYTYAYTVMEYMYKMHHHPLNGQQKPNISYLNCERKVEMDIGVDSDSDADTDVNVNIRLALSGINGNAHILHILPIYGNVDVYMCVDKEKER